MVNRQGQTRLANYYDWLSIEERSALEAEIIRKCLARNETQCSFMEYHGMKIIYRRYASLFFIVGVEPEEEVCHLDVVVCLCLTFSYGILLLSLQNELEILEFIHAFVETMDKYFENVCELDIMFNIEKVCIIYVFPQIFRFFITKSLRFVGAFHFGGNGYQWGHC